ncbi:Prefoldin subunit-domain-containing protein [Xylariomycetidae sp. FL2044]|nr:Prefoldin subunit-domain-containing protein [Xylariomycetidae sp. FL2044]
MSMAPERDSLLDLEKHKEQLEGHVEKLSNALDHWCQLRDEYEALRLPVKSLSPQSLPKDRAAVRQEHQGQLLNDKDLAEIFGKNDSNPPTQIVNLITHRLDYVSRNIENLEKQLEASQDKLAAVTVVSNPYVGDDDGLPITEILEELDDDDNVLSYTLRRPGEAQPQLVEALEKAGVEDIHPPLQRESESPRKEAKPLSTLGNIPSPPQSALPTPSQAEETSSKETTAEENTTKKKSVSFSVDTKPAAPDDTPSDTSKQLEDILCKAQEQQDIITDPVFPADESPEDSSLREDMIRYNKQTMEYEMAPIVAELQLEEGSEDDGFDTDDYSEDDDEEEEGNEDQWGRSTSNVVDDDWKRQMLELKERLGRHTFGTGEPHSQDNGQTDPDSIDEGIGRITIRKEAVADTPAGQAPTTDDIRESKKSVRFAPSLDIADDLKSDVPHNVPHTPAQEEVNPVSDVMERTSKIRTPTLAPTEKKSVSRFRQGRVNDKPAIAPERPVDTTRYAPTGPEGKIIATSVLERESSSEAREPDDLDANLLHQQVAEEYHKMRNKLIHRQGGFMKEDEQPVTPVVADEEEGERKRMSRFRAARLARS